MDETTITKNTYALIQTVRECVYDSYEEGYMPLYHPLQFLSEYKEQCEDEFWYTGLMEEQRHDMHVEYMSSVEELTDKNGILHDLGYTLENKQGEKYKYYFDIDSSSMTFFIKQNEQN